MLTKEQIKEFKSRARSLNNFTSVGKNGLTDNVISQVSGHLKLNKLCKVKILRSFLDESGLDKKSVAQDLAERTDSELVQLIGLTVVLYKR